MITKPLGDCRGVCFLLALFFVLGFIFRKGEVEFDIGIDCADGFDDFVVPNGVDGKHNKGFPEINGQFIFVRVQKQRSHILDGVFILDEAKTDIEILFVNGVFRFDKDTDDDGNPEKANENK